MSVLSVPGYCEAAPPPTLAPCHGTCGNAICSVLGTFHSTELGSKDKTSSGMVSMKELVGQIVSGMQEL